MDSKYELCSRCENNDNNDKCPYCEYNKTFHFIPSQFKDEHRIYTANTFGKVLKILARKLITLSDPVKLKIDEELSENLIDYSKDLDQIIDYWVKRVKGGNHDFKEDINV